MADAGRARWRYSPSRLAASATATACSLVRRAFVVGRSWRARGCGGKRVVKLERRISSGAGSYFFTACEKCKREIYRREEKEQNVECVRGRDDGKKEPKKRLGAGKCGRDTSWQVSQVPPPLFCRGRDRSCGRHRSLRASRAPAPDATASTPHAKS